MVKVNKVAVWKVEGAYYESLDQAIKAVRTQAIRELIAEKKANQYEDEADMIADLWDEIETRVEKAMAGT